MYKPIKLLNVELGQPLCDVDGLEEYIGVKALVRLHGAPLGYVQVPVVNGGCPVSVLGAAILKQYTWSIIRQLLVTDLLAPGRESGSWVGSRIGRVQAVEDGLALVTVAVCTRDRPAELALCLEALEQLDYPSLDLIVIDNAPSSDATERLVREKYPNVRYVTEPRPGLDRARNRAIVEARGEIVAFTDDDVVVDPGWVSALARVFVQNSGVMAVTGLVVPYELETEAQLLFEQYGGFGRGFERKWYRMEREDAFRSLRDEFVRRGSRPKRRTGFFSRRWLYYGTGAFGTGANMAFRRELFQRTGGFDPALDVGTATNGGGDLEMFFRVLKAGHTLAYEPGAIVYHRHRREYPQLRDQIANNGVGLYSYLVRTALANADERLPLAIFGAWWFAWWSIRRLVTSLVHPVRVPRDLIWAELKGSLVGLGRYQKARRAARLAETTESDIRPAAKPAIDARDQLRAGIAVRAINLDEPLRELDDVGGYADTAVFVTKNGRLLGRVDIENGYQPIGVQQLATAVVDSIGAQVLEEETNLPSDLAWARITQELAERLHVPEAATYVTPPLPADVPVSVVVATYDRPEDLRKCLACLTRQETARPVEIIVVDNHPASGITPRVVGEFPGVLLVREPRKGSSYARNAGIVASKGAIVITTDDDVTMPPEWVEKLVAPFAEANVMTVTGNILPYELEGQSQLLFEVYGGLGRGFRRVDYASEWFYDWYKLHAVPTWELGGTANAAFRATIFDDPQIGLMDEALGAGVPTGCSEDTYLFYKVAKAGYRIAYQATAHVWHRHRRSPEALRRQLYNYSKGHVAYHLTTWLRDGDARGMYRVTVELPFSYLGRAWKRLIGQSTYPLSLLAVELAGTLAGPLALWRSRRGVARAGRSTPYTAKSLPLRAPSEWIGASPSPRPLEVPEELSVAGS